MEEEEASTIASWEVRELGRGEYATLPLIIQWAIVA